MVDLYIRIILSDPAFFMAGQAMAQSNRVQVKDDWVHSSKESKTKTQHLSEDVVTLYGQEDRTEFTYQVDQEKQSQAH